MSRRIRIYLFGVALGCMVVYFSLIRNRDRNLMGWLPNAKVLEELSSKDFRFSSKAKCQAECLQINESTIKKLFEDGDVLMAESETRKEPKIYVVEIEENENVMKAHFALGKNTTTLLELTKNNAVKSCECAETELQ